MTFNTNPSLMTARSTNPTKASELAVLLGQACLTVLSTAILLRLWRANLAVPFNYWGDTVFELAFAKSIADGGWIWFLERLGAPFGLEIVAFPQNLTSSSLAMKAIALITSEPGLILNLFWLLAITLTSVVCHIALRSLSLSRATSLVMSTLYALLPYALYRNTAHISLTYIFVPVVAAFAVKVLAVSRPTAGISITQDTPNVPKLLLLAASVAIGFDYVYTAFFACFFLMVAGAAGAVYGRCWETFKQVMPVIALISLCAAVNVFPSLASWNEHGVPPNMDYKSVAEAEIYGLKIRHVISPLTSVSLPWTDKDAIAEPVSFPLENENQYAKLGVVGATGFLLAVACGLLGARRGKGVLSWSAGVLTILGTLFATIGGFGAIFNLLVTPDIRAYSRIIVFLAFFAFFVLGLHLDVIRRNLAKFIDGWRKPALGRPLVAIALLCILVVGLFDQGQAAVPLVARYAADKAQADEERQMVKQIERTLPRVRQVYQLPETSFPPDGSHERMVAYDNGRPYLWSQRLKWSWPSFSRKRAAWSRAIGEPLQDKFITNLVISGFDGLWLDRFGYKASDLAILEAALTRELGEPAVTSSRGRYLFFNLLAQREQWLATGSQADRERAREMLMEPIQVRFERGFYPEEVAADGQRRHRWSQRLSAATVENPSALARRAELHAQLSGNVGGVLTVRSGPHTVQHKLAAGPNEFVLPIELAPNSISRIEFSFEGSRIEAPADPRSMYFAIVNSTVQEVR